MSEVFGINVTGTDELRAKLDKAAQSIQREVLEKVRYAGTEIVEGASALCPIKNGHLVESMYKRDLDNGVEVGNKAFYAPFVEFGTGVNVSIPAGLEEYAYQFYVNGLGKGHAHPFFFPTVRVVSADLIKKIETIIDSLK